jgi:hypothetical protein
LVFIISLFEFISLTDCLFQFYFLEQAGSGALTLRWSLLQIRSTSRTTFTGLDTGAATRLCPFIPVYLT